MSNKKQKISEVLVNELPYKKMMLKCGLTVLFYEESSLLQNSGDILLVVKVGSLKEKDKEYGFSHLLEHLLVRAALEDRENLFTNTFDLCKSHETCGDHTNFSFHVENQKQMSLVIKILAKIAIKADLKEKHFDLERDSISIENIDEIEGWEEPNLVRSMIENLLYTDLNIEQYPSIDEAFQSNISSINLGEVTRFYKEWYKPANMCLICVGNFKFPEIIHMAQIEFTGQLERVITLARNDDPVNEDPIIETTGSKKLDPFAVMIFKRSRPVVKELRDLRLSWNALAAMDAFNQYMDSRIPSNVRVIGRCSQDAGSDFIYIFETALTEYPEFPLTVLDSLFTELRYAREFPLPPSYIRIARENIVKNLESAREMFRNDVFVRCSQLRNKLKNNFLYNAAVFDVTSELELARKWQGSDISRTPFSFLDKCTLSIMTSNLIVDKKGVEGALWKAHAKHLKQPKPMPIQKNNTVEFDALVGDLLCDSRDLGKRHEYDTGLVEWRLRNGMKVAYQQSPKSDMCTLFGFGYGGLSQLNEKDYLSCYYATAVVEVLRSSGLHRQFKNSCDVDVDIDICHYTRSIGMSFRRCQLDVALQKVCLLFVTNRMPDGREQLAETLEDIQEAINNGKRLGYDEAVQTARGSKPIYKVSGSETDEIDLVKACNYYNECFKDPSQFTIIIVGNVGVDIVESLIKKYLDSMPLIKCSLPFPKNLRKLKKVVPVDFPEGKIRFCVQSLTDTKLTDCFISVPLSLDIRHMDRDKMLIQNLRLMMEERLLVRLRCVLGKIYTVTSEIEYDGGPSDCNNEYAIMTFNFKVLDDQSASKLVDESIDALEAFRLEGPDKLELTRIKGTEDVFKKLIRAYKSLNGGTDVVSTLKVQAEQDSKILAMEIESWRKEVKRILRYELATSHVSVIVVPKEESESEESESQ